MSNEEKNIAIAEMLGWKFNKKLNCWIKSDFTTVNEDLKFDSDANWQFEAIAWIERQNNGHSYNVVISTKACTISTNTQWAIAYDDHLSIFIPNSNKKKAIFEALYQFSQYLKHKKL